MFSKWTSGNTIKGKGLSLKTSSLKLFIYFLIWLKNFVKINSRHILLRSFKIAESTRKFSF